MWLFTHETNPIGNDGFSPALTNRTPATRIPMTTDAALGKRVILPPAITTARESTQSSAQEGARLLGHPKAATGQFRKRRFGIWMKTTASGGAKTATTILHLSDFSPK